MKKTEIICDSYMRDITYTGNIVDWRIAVINESIPISPNVSCVTDLMIYPRLKNDMHFCSIGCLQKWAIHGGA